MKLGPITPEILLTEEELVVDLASRVRGRGDLTRLADDFGVSPAAISNFLTGGRPPSRGIAAALGYRKVTRFERVE